MTDLQVLENISFVLTHSMPDNQRVSIVLLTRQMLEYIVVYENSLDGFDIELRIKVKVTVGVQKFSPFNAIQTVRPLVELWNKLATLY